MVVEEGMVIGGCALIGLSEGSCGLVWSAGAQGCCARRGSWCAVQPWRLIAIAVIDLVYMLNSHLGRGKAAPQLYLYSS
ncbi:hypothetical protein BJY01DRAFT_225977 [Aspergillus pseudoustus]|uniref:Uncharacterized protein n=1 Tax=Aspergillus pseudoustus TaxID=1810923 RepID=A0ABR4IX03_9EURO